jgi:hypothetical protein
VVGHFSCLILSDSSSKPHKFLVSSGATGFTSKNSATISLQAKIAGRFWKPTKNAPAIANVRAQEVRRKKKFLKKCSVGLLTVVVQRPA